MARKHVMLRRGFKDAAHGNGSQQGMCQESRTRCHALRPRTGGTWTQGQESTLVITDVIKSFWVGNVFVALRLKGLASNHRIITASAAFIVRGRGFAGEQGSGLASAATGVEKQLNYSSWPFGNW